MHTYLHIYHDFIIHISICTSFLFWDISHCFYAKFLPLEALEVQEANPKCEPWSCAKSCFKEELAGRDYIVMYIYIFILSTKNSINSSFIYFKKTEAYLSTHSPCITMFFLKIDCCRELGILNFFKEITPWCSKTLLRVYFVQGFGGLFIPPEKVFGAQHTTVFFP